MTNRRSDKELRASVMRHALQLIKNLRTDGKHRLVFAEDVSALVVAARQLWGKRFINRKINDEQRLRDASVAGLCLECLEKPAMDDDELCNGCAEEAERLEEEILAEIALSDFEKVKPSGRKPH